MGWLDHAHANAHTHMCTHTCAHMHSHSCAHWYTQARTHTYKHAYLKILYVLNEYIPTYVHECIKSLHSMVYPPLKPHNMAWAVLVTPCLTKKPVWVVISACEECGGDTLVFAHIPFCIWLLFGVLCAQDWCLHVTPTNEAPYMKLTN